MIFTPEQVSQHVQLGVCLTKMGKATNPKQAMSFVAFCVRLWSLD